MTKDKLLYLDCLNDACTLGSFISFSFKSSRIIIPLSSYSCGFFNSSKLSNVSILVSDLLKSLLLTNSSNTISIPSSMRIFGIMWIGM